MSAQANGDAETRIVSPPASSGQLLKHFRLEQLVGSGGMGQVYRALDLQLHRPVAVKLLAPVLTSDPQRKQRFLREARAAARISHPAVAQVFYVDEQDDVTFIAMEFVEGNTIRELVHDKALDVLGALDIAIQAAEGLAKAHDLGIVHRDIKPANIMLTPEGHVKILDFGLAKLLDPATGGGENRALDLTQVAQTQSGMVMGTPAYMSPEQVRGAAVDHRADLFSLGVLLYEMATLRSPFQRDSFLDTLHAVAFDETPLMHSERGPISTELQRVVTRCLKKRAEDRYPDARSLARDLRAIRRDIEAGRSTRISWRQRLQDLWEPFYQQPPSRYLWFGLGAIGLVIALNYSLSKLGVGGALFLALGGLYLYRHVRNRPRKVEALFVRRVSKIPEVRLIAIQGRQITVVVDCPIAQLYGRINQHLQACNRKLFFGSPMSVAIQHDLPPESMHKLMTGHGVQFVRDNRSPHG